MNGSHGIATRMSYATAILLALLMLGIPSFFTGNGSLEVAENTAAAPGDDVDRNYVIAVAELTLDTLNPNTYTMVSEGLVIFPLYSYLLQYDVDMNVIGDAARDWSRSSDGLLWNFKLWDNIYWIDPTQPDLLNRHLTAVDVMYTFWSLQNASDSRLHFYFPDIIEDMWSGDDQYDLWIQLNKPFAAIMDSWLGMPILPQYYWDNGDDFTLFPNDPPIGSGPFYYAADNDPDLGSVKLKRNNHWYMTDNYGWQIHTDNIIVKEELSEDGRLLKLENGEIDVMLRVSPALYLDTLPAKEDVERFSYTGGFVYEFNLNQMTDELREQLGWTAGHAYNNQLLLLEPVKRAFAMSVNKTEFVEDMQKGLGAPACSLIPMGNVWHWEVPEEDKIPVDTTAARDLLNSEGWVYDELGNLDPGATPLARKNATTGAVEDVLSFRFYTLDTSDDWEYGALLLAEWCGESGIELNLEIKSVSVMNTLWYTGNYDVWLWDWVMGITGDGAGIMEVLTSMSIGESSDVYWVNETYDRIYNESLYCMDPVYRQQLIDQLQIMAYEDMACQCVAYSADNYGVSTKNWAYESMGDWNNTYFLLPDIWYQWLAMQLYTTDNIAPYVSLSMNDVETTINEDVNFVIGAEDDGPNGLLYRWFFGDGEKTAWSSDPSATHAYAQDGIYTAWVAIREDGPSGDNLYLDNFTTVDKVEITVKDLSNDIPRNLDLEYSPLEPDTGDEVTFVGYAEDAEGDELYYSWDFGGGHWLDGPTVDFQFITEGWHSVTMYVTDDHLGQDERPVEIGTSIYVSRNGAPSVDVPTFTDMRTNTEETFTVSASDPDDPIRLTWYWGDGSFSVTSSATTTHTYGTKGEYTLTVYVDDMTGLADHNVSDSNLVYVYNPGGNSKPNVQSFDVSDPTPYTYQVVTFTGSATDGDGDPLTFTMEFGDGTYAVHSFAATEPNDIVTWSTTHEYDDGGSFTARLYVDDDEANVTENPLALSITVEVNYPPTVSAPKVNGSTGVPTAFSVVAEDVDGNPLQFYWDWDDGTFSATATSSTTHTYAASGEYVYVVWVNDGHGHNESDSNYSIINAIPTVDSLESFSLVEGVDHEFEAVGHDADGDDLTYYWEFGDGATAVGSVVTHQYSGEDLYTCTVHVDDGFPLASHNVSTSCEVNVVPDTELPPNVANLPERTETIGELVTFTVTASDPNGDPITYEWDFGDGSLTASGKTVTHTYTEVNDFTYSVTVTDDGMLSTTKSNVIHIIADQPPVADAGPDQTVDEDEEVQFDGTGSTDDLPPLASYEWTIPSLGVTLPDDSATPTYTFSDPGVYTVVLEVVDSIGQEDTDEVVITVRDVTAPTAVPVATPDTVDMGGTVTLDGSGSYDNVADNIVSWTWEFYDGSSVVTLSGEVVDHDFEYAGEFTVSLTVEDAAGNQGEEDVLVTVNDIEDPVAVATADPDPVNFGESVSLDGSGSYDNAESGIVVWSWEISLDGTVETTLSGEVVSYMFEDLGDYDVTLTVEDEAGNTDSVTIVVTSEDSEDPVAVASADPTTVTVGGTVTFDASDSSDNHVIESYAWDFADETAAGDGVTVEHTFTAAGTYVVTLTVTDESGNTGTDTVTVTVEEPTGNQAPTAVATATPSSAEVGEEVTFSGSASTDSDGTIEDYSWTILSGSTEVATLSGATATYTFTTAGTYTAVLNVTDDGGLWDTASVTVTVADASSENEPPVADAGDDETITVGTEYTFDGSGSSDADGTIVSYVWTFEYDGEEEVLSGASPDFTFELAGTYVVTLTVTDSDGDTDTDTVQITVEEESGAFPLGLVAAGAILALVAVVVVMLLMKRKGGSKGVESVPSEEPPPPQA